MREAADASFNRITIDGDTSTNDSFVLIATQQAGHAPIDDARDRPTAARCAMRSIAVSRAARAGDRARRRGRDEVHHRAASKAARASPSAGRSPTRSRHSPLVKTAFFASDPNLGRILAAVGYAGIADLDQTRIDLFLDDVHVVEERRPASGYREEDGQRVMKQSEITVRVDLHRGGAERDGLDLRPEHDYVKINADYRS